MTMTGNQVKLKLTGELKPLTSCLERIKKLYPVYIQTDIKENDQDSGYHVFITVPESEEA